MAINMDERVDVKENMLAALDPKILSILLKDKTTRQNIIWATDDYAHMGEKYAFDQQITIKLITGLNGYVIRPRIEKTQDGKIVAVFEGDTASYFINEVNMPREFIDMLQVGMIIEAEIIDNKLVSPKFLSEETEKKREEMKSRLNSLFNRNIK